MKKQEESKIANFIGNVLIIICIPILIILLTIAIKANINHDKIPDFMGYKPLICASNSMEDIFKLGDVTITKTINQADLKEEDIITFWDKKHEIVITHRISKIIKDENGKTVYITKGDMNNEVDGETVEFNQIEGKYIGKINYIGNIILWLQKPIGLIVVFLIPILICAITFKINLDVKKTKEKRKEKLLKHIEEKQRNNT